MQTQSSADDCSPFPQDINMERPMITQHDLLERSNLQPDKLFLSSRQFTSSSEESESEFSQYSPHTTAVDTAGPNNALQYPAVPVLKYPAVLDNTLQHQRMSLQPTYQFIEDHENISPRLIQNANIMHHLNSLQRTSLLGKYNDRGRPLLFLYLYIQSQANQF